MRSPAAICLLFALLIPTFAVAEDVMGPVARIGRADPYKNFKFRVVMDGRFVAGFSQVSGLPAATSMGGRRSVTPVVLMQGRTRDQGFEKWIAAASLPARGVVRKDIGVVVQDETGRAVRRYKFRQAWPSKYQGAPDLDANANEVAIQTLTLQNEGVEIE